MKAKTVIFIMLIICSAEIKTHAQAWNLLGNAGTNATNNFIGTTDSKALKFRTNNNVRMTISSAGKIGIGNTSPVFKLDVKGGSINTDSVYRIEGSTVLSVKNNTNTFVGRNSALNNTQGTGNTAIGYSSLYYNAGASGNTAIGYAAMQFANNTTGNVYTNSVAIGYQALQGSPSPAANTGTVNVAIGAHSMFINSSGGINTAVGVSSMYNNTTGSYNTALGGLALFGNNTGTYNTACGYRSSEANSAGIYNTALGSYALYTNTNSNNTAVGTSALAYTPNSQFNVAMGYNAGDSYDNGYNNVFVGANTDVNADGYYNVIAVGQGTMVTSGVSTARFGNAATVSYGGWAGWTNVSDGRYKKNVKENVPGIEFINKLRPVTYTLDASGLDAFLHKDSKSELSPEGKAVHQKALLEKEKITYTGFIAQEVEASAKELGFDFSGVDAAKNGNDVYGLRYAEFVVPLVKAVQELDKQNSSLRDEIKQIKSILTDEQRRKLNSEEQKAVLEQNIPNPFNKSAVIKCTLPEKFSSAVLKIYSSAGIEMKSYPLMQSGKNEITVEANTLPAGIYSFTLIVDQTATDVKQMIITK